jgi:hypothetical protein
MSEAQTGLAAPDPWHQLRLMTEARRRRLSGVALKDETGALGA